MTGPATKPHHCGWHWGNAGHSSWTPPAGFPAVHKLRSRCPFAGRHGDPATADGDRNPSIVCPCECSCGTQADPCHTLFSALDGAPVSTRADAPALQLEAKETYVYMSSSLVWPSYLLGQSQVTSPSAIRLWHCHSAKTIRREQLKLAEKVRWHESLFLLHPQASAFRSRNAPRKGYQYSDPRGIEPLLVLL